MPPLRERAALVRSVPPTVLLVLGLVQLLQNRALWYDEAYSRLASGVPLTTLLSGMWHRTGVISYLLNVPPSYNGPFYVVLHLWVSIFGNSGVALRLPSLLCAVVAVGVVAELGRRLAGPGAGLLSGLLLATGPLLVDETSQARDYGPALLALALCALWLNDWITSGRRLRRAIVAAVCASLMHWFTIPVLIGFALYAWVGRRGTAGRRTAAWLVAACAPAGLLLGWSLAGGTYGAPHPAPVGVRLPVQAVSDWSDGAIALSIALTAAGVLGVWRSQHRVLLLCWFGVPMVLITALEVVRATYFPRYLLFTMVGLALAAALGIASISSLVVRRAAAALLVALSLAATIPRLDDGDREPTPQVIAYLAAHQLAGQPIIAADGRVSLDLETYLALSPRLGPDLVLPPELFTTQTMSDTVWLVRVVLKENSLPVVPAEQRLLDAGWTRQESTLVVGTTTDLRVERWSR
jgi:mannosyltransferase